MGSNIPSFVSFWLFVIATSFVNGVQIRLYSNNDYTGLILESRSTDKCINLPGNQKVKSITTDTCFIQHKNSDCKSTQTWKGIPGNYSAKANTAFVMKSFLVCNDDEGGSQLNVDITNYYAEDNPADVPVVLERYTRVCTCINIPDYVKKLDKWSANNHGNNFIVYFEPNCSVNKWTGTKLGPEHHDYLINIFNYTQTSKTTQKIYNVQSFGPDKSSSYYQSSCQTNILLSELTSKMKILEHDLKQNNLKLTAHGNDIRALQNARRTDAVEQREKDRVVVGKIDGVKYILQDEIEKLKGELQVMSSSQTSSQKDIASIQNAQKVEAVKLMERLGAVDSKIDSVKTILQDEIEELKDKLQVMSSSQISSQKDIVSIQNAQKVDAAKLGASGCKIENVKKIWHDKIKRLRHKLKVISGRQDSSQKKINVLQSTLNSRKVELVKKIVTLDNKIENIEKTMDDNVEKFKADINFYLNNN